MSTCIRPFLLLAVGFHHSNGLVGIIDLLLAASCLVLVTQIAAARAQAQTERTRTEGEERRKTIDHQQEQERVTAQYKAKLEA